MILLKLSTYDQSWHAAYAIFQHSLICEFGLVGFTGGAGFVCAMTRRSPKRFSLSTAFRCVKRRARVAMCSDEVSVQQQGIGVFSTIPRVPHGRDSPCPGSWSEGDGFR